MKRTQALPHRPPRSSPTPQPKTQQPVVLITNPPSPSLSPSPSSSSSSLASPSSSSSSSLSSSSSFPSTSRSSSSSLLSSSASPSSSSSSATSATSSSTPIQPSSLYPFAPTPNQLREVLVPLRLDLSLDQYHISELLLYSLRPPPHSSPSPDLYPLSSTHTNHYSLSVAPHPPSNSSPSVPSKRPSDRKKSHSQQKEKAESSESYQPNADTNSLDKDKDTKRIDQFEQEELVVWKIASGLCEDLDLPRHYDPYVAADLLKQIQAFNALYRAAAINNTVHNNTPNPSNPPNNDTAGTVTDENNQQNYPIPTSPNTTPQTKKVDDGGDSRKEAETQKKGSDTTIPSSSNDDSAIKDKQREDSMVEEPQTQKSETNKDEKPKEKEDLMDVGEPKEQEQTESKHVQEKQFPEGAESAGEGSGRGEGEGEGEGEEQRGRKKRGRKRKYPLSTNPSDSSTESTLFENKEKEENTLTDLNNANIIDPGGERKTRSKTVGINQQPNENDSNEDDDDDDDVSSNIPDIQTDQERQVFEKERERERGIEWLRREVSSALFPPINSPISLIPKFEYPVLIRIDITLNHYNLKDQFEWDLFSEINSPERFVKSLCADLGLNKEFEVAISHSIYEQLMAARLNILHAYSQGNFVLHDPQSKRPRLTMMRDENELKYWEPRLTYSATPPVREPTRSKRNPKS